MNLCFYFSFLTSFYTCEDAVVQEEDATVQPWGRLAQTAASVPDVAAVPDSCVKWSHIFVL
jgi:hypothetical protein